MRARESRVGDMYSLEAEVASTCQMEKLLLSCWCETYYYFEDVLEPAKVNESYETRIFAACSCICKQQEVTGNMSISAVM